jgi:hypothetical protein
VAPMVLRRLQFVKKPGSLNHISPAESNGDCAILLQLS